MQSSSSKGLVGLIGVAVGLGLGQLISFVVVAGETWMIVDKLLFGLGIGVGLSGLIIAVAMRVFRSAE